MRLLAGDIGGTKTILRLVEVQGKSVITLFQHTYASQNFSDLVPMVQNFVERAQETLPNAACFAIAGPVINNSSQLTNLNWSLDNQRLETELKIQTVNLINDFAAVSYGILGLKREDMATLQLGEKQTGYNPIGVIGAGTGLGQGFLIPHGSQYQPFPAEGGHCDFAPRNQLEWELLLYIKDKYKIERVSVERVVSGQGIVSIYQYLRDSNFASESPEIGAQIRNWEQGDKSLDPGAIISPAAVNERDKLCQKTLEMFIEAYGAETGNLALKILPYSGIYIAGGIAAKILPLMQNGSFIKAFLSKGRMSSVIEKIPVHIVLNHQVGLIGSVLHLVDTLKIINN